MREQAADLRRGRFVTTFEEGAPAAVHETVEWEFSKVDGHLTPESLYAESPHPVPAGAAHPQDGVGELLGPRPRRAGAGRGLPGADGGVRRDLLARTSRRTTPGRP
ncbi:hypothetical protein [Streptomyces albireticuli]|uniref:hypothetical protein n=1 Tax=Streptomyces albireticuli TaxID=1940 RepID=UPI003AF14D72